MGWDVDGGYVDLVVVDEVYVYCLLDVLDDVDVVFLFCLGIVGYCVLCWVSLLLGGCFGLYGFGVFVYVVF